MKFAFYPITFCYLWPKTKPVMADTWYNSLVLTVVGFVDSCLPLSLETAPEFLWKEIFTVSIF